jgi:hypothetical protein
LRGDTGCAGVALLIAAATAFCRAFLVSDVENNHKCLNVEPLGYNSMVEEPVPQVSDNFERPDNRMPRATIRSLGESQFSRAWLELIQFEG